jgi:hypothetical protein
MFTLMISRVCNMHLKKSRTFESLTKIGSGVLWPGFLLALVLKFI